MPIKWIASEFRDHYYAIRAGEPSNNPPVRIEKARSPIEACQKAFGRGLFARWAYLDFGTRVSVLRNMKQRSAALSDPSRWVEMKNEKELK